MASSGLRGPFPLTHQGINDNVTKTFPGAYALGKIKLPTYYIARVGRSEILSSILSLEEWTTTVRESREG